MTDPGQFCERCGAFEHQIGKGPPGEVRAGDSVADITARLPSPVAGSRLTPAVQSRGTLKPAPAVGDRDSTRLREGAVGAPQSDTTRCPGRRRVAVGPRRELVRHRAATDGDAPVGGALCVEEAVRAVTQRLESLPPMSSHCSADGGSVAIIALFIGSHRRRKPGSRAVKPSVALNTAGAGSHRTASLPGPG